MRFMISLCSSWIKLCLPYFMLILIGVMLSPWGISVAWADYAGLGGGEIRPEIVLTNFFSIMISLTIHEFAHAWAADRMGDPTPRRYDRLNLNPITMIKAHPFGAFIVPLIGSMNGFLIGWAATPVNPHLVNRKYSLRQAERWISLAGPISNIVLAIISTLLLVMFSKFLSADQRELAEPVIRLMETLILTNIFLALFNLIPVPPLDGFTALHNSIPRSLSHITELINEYSQMILIFVFFFGGKLLAPLVFKIVGLLIQSSLWIFGI